MSPTPKIHRIGVQGWRHAYYDWDNVGGDWYFNKFVAVNLN